MPMIITIYQYISEHYEQLSALLIAAGVFMLLLLFIYNNIRVSKKIARLETLVSDLANDTKALCVGAHGIDARLVALDNRIRRVGERQEVLDTRDQPSREYSYAIKQLKNGASVEQLVNINGLSQAEAELLHAMYMSSNQGDLSSGLAEKKLPVKNKYMMETDAA